jgi:hypothetical protein
MCAEQDEGEEKYTNTNFDDWYRVSCQKAGRDELGHPLPLSPEKKKVQTMLQQIISGCSTDNAQGRCNSKKLKLSDVEDNKERRPRLATTYVGSGRRVRNGRR